MIIDLMLMRRDLQNKWKSQEKTNIRQEEIRKKTMLELPRKFEDQRPLVLNCKIGGIPFDKTLCDT